MPLLKAEFRMNGAFTGPGLPLGTEPEITEAMSLCVSAVLYTMNRDTVPLKKPSAISPPVPSTQ